MNLPHHGRKTLVALACLVATVWWLPSFFSAERYRRRLETGLEHALHRPVSFGAVSFRLLPRPGFSIANAVVREDPAFGSEPFARVDRMQCDLRWRSLWRSGLEFSRLRLEGASFNLARSSEGQWSIESLIRSSGIATPPGAEMPSNSSPTGDSLLEADDTRINFIVGANKKPFAITGLRARVEFDPARRLLKYRLAGSPVRTDLRLPSPGVLELEGEWTPGRDLEGPLNATLRTAGSMLYDWVPLVSARNAGIYGVLDAEIHLAGSARVVKLDGRCRVTQLHRAEQIPSSDSAPVAIYLRGEFDRNRGRALVESAEASFADSRLHVTGSIDNIPARPELDLVVALERSRLEDVAALGHSFGAAAGAFRVSGRVDGLLSIQGPWGERRYGGFVSAREVHLRTPSATFPVSELAVHIYRNGARLAPAWVTLAPRVELAVAGSLERRARPRASPGSLESLYYDLALSARAVPLRDLVRLARGLGAGAAQNFDAQGIGTASLRLTGPVWPLARPTLVGRAEIRAARLFLPGLTEPLNVPSARLAVRDGEVVADRVVAVMGTSVFSGELRHRGDRARPWEVSLRTNSLSLEQAAQWFDVLGLRRPVPLLDRLPGLGSSTERRAAASNLFGALNATGRFSAAAVTYRALNLKDFGADVEISGRVVRVGHATFRAGGGRGQGQARVDLTTAPAAVVADAKVSDAALQSLAPRLPVALRQLRGAWSGSGHFETRGLSRDEMSANLEAQATVRLRNVDGGDFDPLATLAQSAGWGSLEPERSESLLRSATLALRVRDRLVSIEKSPIDWAGAKLTLGGTYAFDGTADLDVTADLRHIRRRWVSDEGSDLLKPIGPVGRLHLTGPLGGLAVTVEAQLSRAVR